MRQPIRLDFAGARPGVSVAGGVLLALGLAAIAAVLIGYRITAQHRAGLEVRFAAVNRAALRARPTESPGAVRAAVSAQQAALDLATPWTLLLAELEQASKDTQGQVAVLGAKRPIWSFCGVSWLIRCSTFSKPASASGEP